MGKPPIRRVIIRALLLRGVFLPASAQFLTFVNYISYRYAIFVHHHNTRSNSMHTLRGILPVIIGAASLVATVTPVLAFQCNECHSKNPAMVRMHEALRGRGCFDCHKVGQKLMGKGQPKDLHSLMARRSSDPLCVECHKK